MSTPIIQVALPLPIPKLFDYAVPEELWKKLRPGMRVEVPFGKRKKIGLAIGWVDQSEAKKLKEISTILDETPVVPEKLLAVILWGADHYITSPGEALKSALPALLWKPLRNKRTPSAIDRAEEFSNHPRHELTEAQQRVFQAVSNGGTPNTFLLHGITGSGKTEIYLELTRHIVGDGGSVLVLVPEIALTPQLLGRFQTMFGEAVGIYHSGLTDRQREQVWEDCLAGKLPVMIGTRSALFLPRQNLRLIIVDEEHDSSYKQEERFRYHARDLAVLRGHLEEVTVLLGSATPSLESYSHAQSDKYRYLQLTERPGRGNLPDVKFIDLRRQKPAKKGEAASLISEELATALDETLQRNEQSLIFLNRRGFSPLQLCQDCGEALQCPHCHITLTLHKKRQKIVCHYCDYQQKETTNCAECNSSRMVWVSSGTERIEEELQTRFPRARIGRLDRDTMQKRGALTDLLSQMKRHELDILVGTQILTKGHDYPAVTLVGVLLAEQSLRFPDLRAAERTFQLITQVAGRAGRGDQPGQVLVQGYNPHHYSLRCALSHDYDGFAKRELGYRNQLGYPPFARLIQLVFRAKSQNDAVKAARQGTASLRQVIGKGATILGPSPCPIEKLRDEYRWQTLIKTHNFNHLKAALLDADFRNSLPLKVKFGIDVDPINML